MYSQVASVLIRLVWAGASEYVFSLDLQSGVLTAGRVYNDFYYPGVMKVAHPWYRIISVRLFFLLGYVQRAKI